MLSKTEQQMWASPPRDRPANLTTAQINEKYERGEQRIVTETNIEKLPNFVEALKRNNYMELRPFYQRRSRWDEERQSKLIESFVINIPVPPLFLYERAYNSYEVMDGQQRITAIADFYGNKFKLTGLDLWPELNGMTYTDLPNKIRSGLDRRSISSIILLKESAPDEEDAIFLRQLVFERLNTGGVKLARQEIRNALSKSAFNEVLYELSRGDLFRDIWGLPRYSAEEETNHKQPIFEYQFFASMEDIEVVLRFFALRHMKHFRYGIQGFLDLYMIRSKSFDQEDVDFFRSLFTQTLHCAHAIYGDKVFRTFQGSEWSRKPVKGMYDAVMVPLSEFLGSHDELIAKSTEIVESTRQLFIDKGPAAVTGRASTRRDLEDRIAMFRNIFLNHAPLQHV
jgi:hypothetical protein